MAAIAYVTDSKMLSLHRLNNHKTINFWRLSNKSFTNFNQGDLVFFLSKGKQHLKKDEKGIVGFGRLTKIYNHSVKLMWDKFEKQNGYININEFKQAIIKNSKSKSLPKKISSFYLENVTFFQPIYLSDCGINISKNIESYTYLDSETTLKLLEMAKGAKDLWSLVDDSTVSIEKEELICALFMAHNKIGETNKSSKSVKVLSQITQQRGFDFIQNSTNEIYKINEQYLEIIMYHDNKSDDKQLIGQAQLYRHYMSLYYKPELKIKFITSDNNEFLNYQLNVIEL